MAKGILAVVLGLGLVALCGCDAAEPVTTSTITTEAVAAITTTEPETAIQAIDPPKEIPQLRKTGKQLDDFIPEGWCLLDSVSLDFNKDGRGDYVGILEHASVHRPLEWPNLPSEEIAYTRILFAVKGTVDGYQLDFQDENLVRRQMQGGPFGDPYSGLEANGSAFTSSAYGGSSWKWNDEHTFQYKDGAWYLIKRLQQGFRGPQIGEQLDDYAIGTGTHWSIDDDIIMEWYKESRREPDLLYKHKVEEIVKLGPPPTLEAFSRAFAQEMYR